MKITYDKRDESDTININSLSYSIYHNNAVFQNVMWLNNVIFLTHYLVNIINLTSHFSNINIRFQAEYTLIDLVIYIWSCDHNF